MQQKHLAEGTAGYRDAATACRQVLVAAKNAYLNKKADELGNLKRGSKKWWRVSKQVTNQQASPSFFPALKNETGRWCVTPGEKANAFASCWSAKFEMLPEIAEQFFPQPQQVINNFVPIRERTVKRILAGLQEDQARDPDGIPALFWRKLLKVFRRPFTVLTLQETAWPEKWRIQSIVQI